MTDYGDIPDDAMEGAIEVVWAVKDGSVKMERVMDYMYDWFDEECDRWPPESAEHKRCERAARLLTYGAVYLGTVEHETLTLKERSYE